MNTYTNYMFCPGIAAILTRLESPDVIKIPLNRTTHHCC
jgi:hypothetical protein